MYVKRTNGNSFDTEFPVENNPNRIMSVNKTGLLVSHGDSDGSFFFYPWSSIELIATSKMEEQVRLGGL